MFPKPIQELVNYFLKFPGVGPKQAARFVFYLLKADPVEVKNLSQALVELREEIKICTHCYKIFDANHLKGEIRLCEFCRDSSRNPSQILVIEKEVELHRLENTKKYSGLYHVLGGVIDPLDSSSPVRLHLRELFSRVKALLETKGQAEVILATNPTAEGEATALYIERMLSPLKNHFSDFKISRLGRGMSTGSELEYSDEITILNALQNRK